MTWCRSCRLSTLSHACITPWPGTVSKALPFTRVQASQTSGNHVHLAHDWRACCVCLCTPQPFAKWSAAETFDENRLAFATPTSTIISSAEASERREAQRARLCETLRAKSEEVRAPTPPSRRTLLAGGRAGPRRPFAQSVALLSCCCGTTSGAGSEGGREGGAEAGADGADCGVRQDRGQACRGGPTLETTLGQMAPPTSGHPLRMPPDSGGILRGCPLLGGAICPNVVSRVGCSAAGPHPRGDSFFFITLKPRVE